MKTMIEVDLPKGVTKAEAEGEIKQHFSPDWTASWWHISDIHCQANNSGDDEADVITDEQAREVLRLMERHHDSEVGLNWDVIDAWIDHVKKLRKEVA